MVATEGGCSSLPRKKAFPLSLTAETNQENGIISPSYTMKQCFTGFQQNSCSEKLLNFTRGSRT